MQFLTCQNPKIGMIPKDYLNYLRVIIPNLSERAHTTIEPLEQTVDLHSYFRVFSCCLFFDIASPEKTQIHLSSHGFGVVLMQNISSVFSRSQSEAEKRLCSN